MTEALLVDLASAFAKPMAMLAPRGWQAARNKAVVAVVRKLAVSRALKADLWWPTKSI
jgi:hypothetical protein